MHGKRLCPALCGDLGRDLYQRTLSIDLWAVSCFVFRIFALLPVGTSAIFWTRWAHAGRQLGRRSLSQIEGLTGLPMLGMVPMIVRMGRGTQPHQLAFTKPGSVYG